MIYRLPKALEVGGVEQPIRSDFRDVLTVIFAMNDPNLEDKEKSFVCLYVLYENFETIAEKDYKEAFEKAFDFINHNSGSSAKTHYKVIDFEQDEDLLIPAVNRVAGCEVRSLDYLHWWTFMGYFMEIGECTYSQVLSIRNKRAHGKKLEKWETEFFDRNKELIIIKEKLSDDEILEKEMINKLLS